VPLYEYACQSCDHRFEVLQKMGESGSGLVCPACGARGAEKQYSTFAGSSAAEGSTQTCSPSARFT
jgi:putative FmdB family regulatory protein